MKRVEFLRGRWLSSRGPAGFKTIKPSLRTKKGEKRFKSLEICLEIDDKKKVETTKGEGRLQESNVRKVIYNSVVTRRRKGRGGEERCACLPVARVLKGEPSLHQIKGFTEIGGGNVSARQEGGDWRCPIGCSNREKRRGTASLVVMGPQKPVQGMPRESSISLGSEAGNSATNAILRYDFGGGKCIMGDEVYSGYRGDATFL